MTNNPSVFVDSAEEGLQKVKRGGFAYILGIFMNKNFNLN